MCKFLEVTRSLIYYYLNKENPTDSNEESIITNHIKNIFKLSRNNYGTRKIKKELHKLDYQISRRRISRIIKENVLVSNYTVAKYKVLALYDNILIDDILNAFKIDRSLSRKGNPYDNAVSELHLRH